MSYTRFVVTSGQTHTLISGTTYTNPDIYATVNGGAGEVQTGGVLIGNTVSFRDNLMNNEGFCGGAIYNAGTASITGSTFSNNGAYDCGGAIYNNSGTVSISDSTLSGNLAGSWGGAIHNDSGTVTITGSTFSNNEAYGMLFGGGAICNFEGTVNFTGEVTLATSTDTIFNSNNSTLNWDLTGTTTGKLNGYQWLTNGGTLTITVGASQAKATYTLATGDFTTTTYKETFTIKGVGDTTQTITIGSSATYNGITYRLYTSGNQLILNSFERFTVENNQTKTLDANRTYTNPEVYDLDGGAGEVKSSGVLIASTVSISGNTADDSGGAICNLGTVSISGSTLSGNMACSYGGAICNLVGTVSISGSTLSGNMARFFGGAISNDDTVSITGSTLSGNTAGNSGGAICNDGGIVSISCSTFSGNTAAYNGGAISNDGGGTVSISCSTFSGNTTNANGGAICNNGGGTVNFTGEVTLGTSTDTIYNSNVGTLNWDLTGDTTGKLNGYQWLTNNGGILTITVSATQTEAMYVLATGDFTNVSGKDTFTITGVSGQSAQTITIGGTALYGGETYALNVIEGNLMLTIYNVSTLYVNSTYSGEIGTQTPDGHIVGVDAFTSLDAAIAAGGETIIQTGGTYGNGSTADIFAAQGKTLTVQTAAYNTSTILAGGKHSNTAASRIWVYESGATNLTIDAGTFRGNVIGADVCTTGSQQRTGDVNMTIHGGNFTTSVAGGMYYRSSTHGTTLEQKLNSVCLIGNVNLAIDGGSFNKRVYGGNYASNDNWGGQTLLDGSINLTIDASDAITFSDHVIAGSRGEGCISGNVNVTVTGNGANLNFANGKYLFGASGAAYYKTSGGARSDVSYVDGSRNLVFDDFQGQFSGKISMFQKITFSGDTQMSFKASQNVSLSDISSWELNWDGDVDTYADLTGVTNTFAGDTVNINFDSASNEDVLLKGAAGAFASLTDATVKFNDTQVAFDSVANGWVSGSNKLYISDDGTQLKMTTIA